MSLCILLLLASVTPKLCFDVRNKEACGWVDECEIGPGNLKTIAWKIDGNAEQLGFPQTMNRKVNKSIRGRGKGQRVSTVQEGR